MGEGGPPYGEGHGLERREGRVEREALIGQIIDAAVDSLVA